MFGRISLRISENLSNLFLRNFLQLPVEFQRAHLDDFPEAGNFLERVSRRTFKNKKKIPEEFPVEILEKISFEKNSRPNSGIIVGRIFPEKSPEGFGRTFDSISGRITVATSVWIPRKVFIEISEEFWNIIGQIFGILNEMQFKTVADTEKNL